MTSPVCRTLAAWWRAALILVAGARPAALALLAALRRAGAALAELNRLQERLGVRRMSYDPYLARPDAPPETYREFLIRTSGPLRHEPSARARLGGRPVR